MTAETIARALGGHRYGDSWQAPCPAHDDRKPSLSLTDGDNGRVLVYCHAGCEPSRIIDVLRSRGLWGGTGPQHRHRTRQRSGRTTAAPPVGDSAERTATALRLWDSTIPAPGTLAETYLHSRGIVLAIPPSIRFHPRLKHPSGGFWPGLVALVSSGLDGKPLAIHRTFLDWDGAGKVAISPQKMMLGPCRGGAVRLAVPERTLMVGEGIETCLAAFQATGVATWAALSTSGLRRLDLHTEIREVIVLADGDEPGEAAALDAARRWQHEGRAVRIARPPPDMDFNDILLGRQVLQQKGAT